MTEYLDMDRYEIIQKLHTPGAKVEILHCRDKDEDHEYVLRVFTGLGSEGGSLQKQVDHMKRIEHDNLVRVHGFFCDKEGLPIIKRDYVPGKSLDRLLSERGIFDEDEVKKVAIGTAKGLLELEQDEITPTSLALSDVIIKEDGNPVIVGFAKPVDEEKRNGYSSASYMSDFDMLPKADKEYSYASFLGRLCIGMLTGKYSSDNRSLRRSISGKIDYRKHCVVSDDFADVIDRLVDSDATRRYGSMNEVIQAIESPTEEEKTDKTVDDEEDSISSRARKKYFERHRRRNARYKAESSLLPKIGMMATAIATAGIMLLGYATLVGFTGRESNDATSVDQESAMVDSESTDLSETSAVEDKVSVKPAEKEWVDLRTVADGLLVGVDADENGFTIADKGNLFAKQVCTLVYRNEKSERVEEADSETCVIDHIKGNLVVKGSSGYGLYGRVYHGVVDNGCDGEVDLIGQVDNVPIPLDATGKLTREQFRLVEDAGSSLHKFMTKNKVAARIKVWKGIYRKGE